MTSQTTLSRPAWTVLQGWPSSPCAPVVGERRARTGRKRKTSHHASCGAIQRLNALFGRSCASSVARRPQAALRRADGRFGSHSLASHALTHPVGRSTLAPHGPPDLYRRQRHRMECVGRDAAVDGAAVRRRPAAPRWGSGGRSASDRAPEDPEPSSRGRGVVPGEDLRRALARLARIRISERPAAPCPHPPGVGVALRRRARDAVCPRGPGTGTSPTDRVTVGQRRAARCRTGTPQGIDTHVLDVVLILRSAITKSAGSSVDDDSNPRAVRYRRGDCRSLRVCAAGDGEAEASRAH